MLIDWFTVIAQIVNFLVLVFLLRYFLYGPIIRAMDAREARIAEDLEAAERKRKEAAEEIAAYQEKNRELEATRDKWLNEAKEEAETRRKELTKKARQEVNEAKERWYAALEQEKEAFLQALRQRVGRESYAILQRALADLADEELDKQIIAVFERRLNELDEEARREIGDALAEESEEIVIHSAHDLPEEMRQRLVEAAASLHTDSNNQLPINFQTNPDLIGGLEMRAAGYKIAWSLADYLESLEESVNEALQI